MLSERDTGTMFTLAGTVALPVATFKATVAVNLLAVDGRLALAGLASKLLLFTVALGLGAFIAPSSGARYAGRPGRQRPRVRRRSP